MCLAEVAASEKVAEVHRRLAAAYLGQVFDAGPGEPAGLDADEAELERKAAITSALQLLSNRLSTLAPPDGTEASFGDLLSSLDDIEPDSADETAKLIDIEPLRAIS